MSENCTNDSETSNLISGSNENFKVAIRVRPMNERECRSGRGSGWLVQSDTGQIQQTLTVDGRPINGPSFSFGINVFINSFAHLIDAVFGPELTCNRELFERVARSIVDDTLDGVNGSIFAYGQTSTGKTFTMQGTQSNPGLIPLAIRHIFSQIAKVMTFWFFQG